ncbi:MAG: DUF2304 domain-containing protein [Lachnospiraceae bacterium]|jgi:hypothetical protein|nr:DUF2304 domain-containing protein [Lachnospiraceae bacterium]
MSNTLRYVMLIGVLFYFYCIFYFLKKKSLSLKYSLLWITTGIIMGIIALFPQIIYVFVKLIGIQTPVNGLYAICIFMMMLILISLTSIVSKQTERIKNLTQYIAILEKDVREITDDKTTIKKKE